METNLLLGLALTIVSNFCNTVHSLPEAQPRDPTVIRYFSVGRKYFPYDLFIEDKRGDRFWIHHGVVSKFETPESFTAAQEIKDIPKFIGTPIVTTNEVIELCGAALKRLAGTNTLPVAAKPRLRARNYKGQTIVVYEVNWPLPEGPSIYTYADMEFDARSGVIVTVKLWDDCFYNPQNVMLISNLVVQARGAPGTQ